MGRARGRRQPVVSRVAVVVGDRCWQSAGNSVDPLSSRPVHMEGVGNLVPSAGTADRERCLPFRDRRSTTHAARAICRRTRSLKVSPQVNGICSSGATGTPKVIITPGRVPDPATVDPKDLIAVATAGDPRDGADVPHERLRNIELPPRWRPAGGAAEVRCRIGSRRDREAADHDVHGDTDDAAADRRRTRKGRATPSSVDWILQVSAAGVAAHLV